MGSLSWWLTAKLPAAHAGTSPTVAQGRLAHAECMMPALLPSEAGYAHGLSQLVPKSS